MHRHLSYKLLATPLITLKISPTTALTVQQVHIQGLRKILRVRIVLLYNAIHSVINLSDSYNTIKCRIIAFYYESKFDPHDTCTFHLVLPL